MKITRLVGTRDDFNDDERSHSDVPINFETNYPKEEYLHEIYDDLFYMPRYETINKGGLTWET